MEQNKSVIEHLEGIEETLETKDKKPSTISEMIGEPFDPYFDTATVYYYESDERKFNKHKSEQRRKQIINIVLFSIPLIFHLVLSFILNEYSFANYIADILFVLPSVIYLIYATKQKNKKLANSKFNIRNHIFYKYENKLGEEDNKGLFSRLMLVYKPIAFLLFFSPILLAIFGNYNELYKTILLFGYYGFAVIYLSLYIALNNYNEYYYHSFIFDNKDSYVLYQYGEWTKVQK